MRRGRPRLVPEDYVQASFRIDPRVYEACRVEGAKNRQSIGAFMREAVEEKLAKTKRRRRAS